MYKYVQIFVISNGTYTRYFANTTAQNKNNYEFTCEWADAKNKVTVVGMLDIGLIGIIFDYVFTKAQEKIFW